uniref:Anti-CBASS protein Acb1-like N-terminal domain-containing protein n=1 Tax=viral metagenome TaxID=1070528 RepID=A0A6M3M0D9_9ZZZZ
MDKPTDWTTKDLERYELAVENALLLAERTDSIVNELTGLGTTADKGRAGRPDTTQDWMDPDELEALYEHNGMARRLIDIIPDECIRRGWKITDPGGDSDLFNHEERRLGLVKKVADGMRWGRLYGGAVILMVVEDGEDDWSKPMRLEKVKRLQNLVVFDYNECSVINYESNIHNPNYRAASMWQLTPTEGYWNDTGGADWEADQKRRQEETISAGWGGKLSNVHHSRVLYFPGGLLPPSRRFERGGFDLPIMEYIFEAVRDLTSVVQGASTVAQELRRTILKIDGFGASQVGDQSDLVRSRIRAIQMGMSVLNWAVVGDGDEIEQQTADVRGFNDLSDLMWQMLAGVTGMSITRLRGDAPGGLSTDDKSGRANWTDVIAAIQQHYLLDILLRLYSVMYAADEGPTKGKMPEWWDIEFLPLAEPTTAETAAERKVRAETDAIYIQAGVLSAEQVASSRFGENGYQDDIQPIDHDDFNGPNQIVMAQEQERADAKYTSSVYAVPVAARGRAQFVLASLKSGKLAPEGLSADDQAAAEHLVAAPYLTREYVLGLNIWFEDNPSFPQTVSAWEVKPDVVAFYARGGQAMAARSKSVAQAQAFTIPPDSDVTPDNEALAGEEDGPAGG